MAKERPMFPQNFTRWAVGGFFGYHVYSELKQTASDPNVKARFLLFPSVKANSYFPAFAGIGAFSLGFYAPYIVSTVFFYDNYTRYMDWYRESKEDYSVLHSNSSDLSESVPQEQISISINVTSQQSEETSTIRQKD